MSALLERIAETIWPWQSGPGQTVYQLISKLNPISLNSLASGDFAQEVRMSLVSQPGYLDSIVSEALDSLKFSHGKLPIKVKLSTRDVSSSLRYGLVQSQQTLLVRGDKKISDQFLARVKSAISQDTRDSRVNIPRVLSVSPENWLTSGSIESSSGNLVPSDSPIRSLGLTGILIGAIAGLLVLSKQRSSSAVNHLREATAHLEKRGFQNPQLVKQDSVEDGEKFHFQTSKGECTVVVDRKGRVFSWTRIPPGNTETS